ncbi:MAG TPA: aminotransferase class I/II-fold pyridoxal phosphate-dependent enzyme [Bryobacteraceae bacterium]|nr:aminotransferase class I/II-fold pyridoxal phosphate-dependent enzyme [Bryobacteraceae bacterium]
MSLPTDEFYRISKLPPYVFAVVNEMKAKLRAEQQDVVDLGMGNPDGATPRPIVNKAIEAMRNSRNHRYSLSKGIPRLREEIVQRYKKNYGVELEPTTEAIATIGAKDALAHLLFAVIGPGDAVVSPNPAYPIHQYGVVMAEGHACMLPMPDPGTFLNGLEDLYRRSVRKPRLILISFPHNPTTQCVDLDFHKAVVDLARHHGSMVVHDFAYADICFDGYRAPSILQVPGAKDVAVEIFSMSKSYNMAGWRLGFCLGNKKMIAALARIKSYLDYGVFQPLQIAGIIALRECEDDTRKICAMYQKRRDLLVDGLNKAGWPIEKPRGSMFVWAPIPEQFRAMGSLEFSKLLLQKALVAVSPGIGFGPLGEGFVRFALIENDQRSRQAIRAIKQFLRNPTEPAATGDPGHETESEDLSSTGAVVEK